MRLIVALLLLSPLAEIATCEPSGPPRQEFAVRVRAINPEGDPLPGVVLGVGGSVLGTTGQKGELGLRVFGVEGEQVQLQAACPPGHSGPRENPLVALRRFQSVDPNAPARTEITLTCTPAQRVTAVAIRTGQPSIPVRLRGEELARTNEAGIAHVLLRQEAGSAFQLTLDTAERAELRPESPTRMFAIGDRDDFVVWDQAFVLPRPPPPPPPPRRIYKPPPPPPPPPPVPYRLGS